MSTNLRFLGRPISHRLASASVLHDRATLADAYATALMVLGPEAGMDFARNRNLAALFLIYSGGGEFEERLSPAFESFLDQDQSSSAILDLPQPARPRDPAPTSD